jgi:hypothetical protein
MNTNEDNLNVILTLLDKAEQILGILNLSDTTIGKYNQLKELAFEKLGLQFYPVVSKVRKVIKNTEGSSTGGLGGQLIDKLKNLSAKKSVLIEFLFDLIEKMKFEDNIYMKQYLLDNNMMKQLEKGLNSVVVSRSQGNDDLEFDLKLEDIKIKDYFCKSEIFYKGFLGNMNKSGRTGTIDSESYNHVEDIARDFELRVEAIKQQYENEFEVYKERFNELRIKYNPDMENELFAVRSGLQDRNFLVDKINEMVIHVYDQHYEKNAGWYEEAHQEPMKPKDLEVINFLVALVDKFFNDNKYLIEMIGNLQKENNSLVDDRNLPFVANAIHKNHLLKQICEDSKIVEENVRGFHKEFEDVIDFINKNFENLN